MKPCLLFWHLKKSYIGTRACAAVEVGPWGINANPRIRGVRNFVILGFLFNFCAQI